MRILLSLAAMAAAVCTATVANATAFVGTFDVTANQGSGLIINSAPDNGPVSFNLTPGHSVTQGIFDIYTPESALNGDDLNARPISVAFNFTAPTGFGGTVGGTTDTAIFGIFDAGSVHWTNPAILTFGNGGVLQISLSDEVFNGGFIGSFNDGVGHGAEVHATYKLIHDSLPGVPEPASWALMIGGFGMAGSMLRRRRTAFVA